MRIARPYDTHLLLSSQTARNTDGGTAAAAEVGPRAPAPSAVAAPSASLVGAAEAVGAGSPQSRSPRSSAVKLSQFGLQLLPSVVAWSTLSLNRGERAREDGKRGDWFVLGVLGPNHPLFANVKDNERQVRLKKEQVRRGNSPSLVLHCTSCTHASCPSSRCTVPKTRTTIQANAALSLRRKERDTFNSFTAP